MRIVFFEVYYNPEPVDSANKNGGNGTTVTTNDSYTGTVPAGTNFTMTFDMAITGGNNQANTVLRVLSADGYILEFDQIASGLTASYSINRSSTQTVTFTQNTWYNITVTRSGANTFLTIKDSSGEIVSGIEKLVITSGSANGGITGMSFATGRYYANLKMDNIVIRDIQEGDVPAAVLYNVDLQTAPYAQVVVNGATHYSGADGSLSLGTAETGTEFSYTISKGGYEGTSGSATVEAGPLHISAPISLSDSSYFYYEDFNTASGESLWLATSIGDISTPIAGGRLRVVSTNSATRGGRKAFDAVTDGTYSVDFDMEMTDANSVPSSGARQETVSVRD